MTLTAQQVLDAQFKVRRFRGYDQEEVDDFLDLMIRTLERYENLSVSWQELAKAQRLNLVRRAARIRAASEAGHAVLADDEALDEIAELLRDGADAKAITDVIRATGRDAPRDVAHSEPR